MHEWKYDVKNRPLLIIDEEGNVEKNQAEPVENLITWVYADTGFTPSAKIQNGAKFSIINDYLGTPIQAYNEFGENIWERELSIYGETRIEKGFENFIPFTYQGQYFDFEIELCYNRFRYYDFESGNYISKDPIGLSGEMANMYAYVSNCNRFTDPFGLTEHITFPTSDLHPNAQGIYTIDATGYHHNDKVALYESANLKEGFDSSKWISHHIDYDPVTNKMRMQLVSLDAHKKNHIGGVNDFEKHHEVKYNTESASKIIKSYH